MTAITLGIPEHQVRVVAPAVGGGVRLEAQRLRRGAARASRWPASTACRCAGPRSAPRTRRPPSTAAARSRTSSWPPTPTASSPRVRVRLLADMGAYLQLVTPGIPLLGAFLYAGVYDLPAAYDFACTSVFTTMTPTDAYRGAGRPEATYAIERAMDALAAQGRRRPGRAPAAQLHPDRRSSRTRRSAGWSTTRGNHDGAADEGRWSWSTTTSCGPQQAHAERRGRDRSTSASACRTLLRDVRAGPVAGCWPRSTTRPAAGRRPRCGCCRPARCRSSPAPRRTARATRRRWSMIVADKLGVSPDDVDVLHSDTAIAPLGLDTYGSRSLAVGGVAIAMACDKVIDKAQHDRRPPARGGRGRPRVRRRRVHGAGLARQGDAAGRRSRSRRSPPTTCPTAWSRTSRPRSPTTRRTSRGRSAPTSCVVEVDDGDRAASTC